MISGQSKIGNKIYSLTLDTFPRTLLLEGKKGSGRRSIIKEISNKLNLEINDISNQLSNETIDDIACSVKPSIYFINTESITVKNENVILKFLEEPLKNSFIILICEDSNQLIPTIKNRCQVWKLEEYTKEFLNTFIEPKYDATMRREILEFCETPGQIIEYQILPINDMSEYATKIFTCISSANIANVLNISNAIAYKNEKDKFDFNLFCKILTKTACKLFRENKISVDAYMLTQKLNHNRTIFNIDKKYLFEKYLINLKECQ